MAKDNKLFNLTDNIISWTDGYYSQFADATGKINYSEAAVSDLNKIVGEVFKLNNHIVENKLFSDNEDLMTTLAELNTFADKLKISVDNAKKLDIKKAINYWENVHSLGFKAALIVATMMEYYKEEK